MSIKSFSSFNEEASNKWIQDAIKNAGALKKSLGKKKGEKISKSEISDEISKLKKKDKDPKKKGVQGLSKKDLTKYKRLNLAKTLKGLKEHKEHENYMFFGNLETMKRLIDELMKMDHSKIDSILTEHDWASDHISVATENLEQVFDFLAGHESPEGEEFISEEPMEDEESYSDDQMNEEPMEDDQMNEEPMEDEESKIKGFKDFQ
jgi:hypothetical protein